MKDVLSIVTAIVLIVIYIPIIYLIIKRRRKKLTWYALFPFAIILFPILFLVIWSNVPYYYLPAFEGKVIDVETKQSIEGAAVLAVYYDKAVTIAGANRFAIDAQEGVTDANGKFKLPEVKEWFGERPGTVVEAELIIFKPGYGAFPRHKRSKVVGENKSWLTPEKFIVYGLPKLKTREERKRNAKMRTYHEIPYEKQRFYIEAINAERNSLGLPLMQVPNKKRQK